MPTIRYGTPSGVATMSPTVSSDVTPTCFCVGTTYGDCELLGAVVVGTTLPFAFPARADADATSAAVAASTDSVRVLMCMLLLRRWREKAASRAALPRGTQPAAGRDLVAAM